MHFLCLVNDTGMGVTALQYPLHFPGEIGTIT